MTIQTRDVIFTFENSCNSDCFKWFKCCQREIEDDEAVYVTPKGQVKRFDFRARGGANANAQRTLSNIQEVLKQLSDDHNKMAAIMLAIEHQMNLSLEPPVPHIINAAQVKRIEAIALPIIRGPSPSPKEEKHNTTPIREDHFVWPHTPKRGLVRSPEVEDLTQGHFEMVEKSEAVVD